MITFFSSEEKTLKVLLKVVASLQILGNINAYVNKKVVLYEAFCGSRGSPINCLK